MTSPSENTSERWWPWGGSFRAAAVASAAVGVFAFLAFALIFLTRTTPLVLTSSIDSRIFGDYGVLVGGVSGSLFTLATILLLIESINEQRRTFARTQLENRFFQMIKLQRQNSDGVSIKQREGRRIFITLLREFDACCEVVTSLTSLPELDERQRLNIAYLAFFYGAVGDTSKKILRLTLSRYGDIFLNDLFDAFARERSRIKARDEFDYEPFDGHQSRLGHYYRHLFQSIRYIDDQPNSVITQSEKYGYVKLLRAQLSTHEQALLFLNSISDLGGAWELDSARAEHRTLITTYRLINNIPYGFLSYAEPRDFYPDVRYETGPRRIAHS